MIRRQLQSFPTPIRRAGCLFYPHHLLTTPWGSRPDALRLRAPSRIVEDPACCTYSTAVVSKSTAQEYRSCLCLLKDRELRDKLGDAADSPRYIFTELGVGYRMPKGEMQGEEG